MARKPRKPRGPRPLYQQRGEIKSSELTPVNDVLPSSLRSMVDTTYNNTQSSNKAKDQTEEELIAALKELSGSMKESASAGEKYQQGALEMFKKIQSRGLESRVDRVKEPMFGKKKFEQAREKAYETIDKYAEGGFKNPQLKRQALDQVSEIEKMSSTKNRAVAGMAIGATVTGMKALQVPAPILARDYKTTYREAEIETGKRAYEAGGTAIGAIAGGAVAGGAGVAAGSMVGSSLGSLFGQIYGAKKQEELDALKSKQEIATNQVTWFKMRGMAVEEDMMDAIMKDAGYQSKAIVEASKDVRKRIEADKERSAGYKEYERSPMGKLWDAWEFLVQNSPRGRAAIAFHSWFGGY